MIHNSPLKPCSYWTLAVNFCRFWNMSWKDFIMSLSQWRDGWRSSNQIEEVMKEEIFQ